MVQGRRKLIYIGPAQILNLLDLVNDIIGYYITGKIITFIEISDQQFEMYCSSQNGKLMQ